MRRTCALLMMISRRKCTRPVEQTPPGVATGEGDHWRLLYYSALLTILPLAAIPCPHFALHCTSLSLLFSLISCFQCGALANACNNLCSASASASASAAFQHRLICAPPYELWLKSSICAACALQLQEIIKSRIVHVTLRVTCRKVCRMRQLFQCRHIVHDLNQAIPMAFSAQLLTFAG